ncbi:MAG: protein-export membrane protein SecD [Deltaproteobacteria bacterium RBG_16_71_12]|nr:MAG: protein-export membrane protein SecD [Deltaproteobacteria bacterium RBG_16_71_12]
MHSNTWPIRLAFVIATILVGAYFLYPTVIYFTLDDAALAEVRADKGAFAKHVPKWAPDGHVVPGLDLQGGVHMVLGVDLDKAIADKARRIASRMRDELADKKVASEGVEHLIDQGKGDRMRVTFKDEAALKTYEADIAENYGDLAEVGRAGLAITYRVHPDWVRKVKTDAVDQTIKTITNRIDKMHVTEPSITKRGNDQVQVQLPGYTNPDEAKSLIGRTAQLEFQMCDDDNDFLTRVEGLPEWAKLESRSFQRRDGALGNDIYLEFPEDNLAEMRAFLLGKVPADLMVKYGHENERVGEAKKMRTYTLRADVDLTGDDLVNAQVAMGSPEQPTPYVTLEFSATGKQIFADLTTKSVGKRMAIVLEDIVDSAPVINEPITGGSAQITMGGSRTRDEMLRDANQLALVLKAGALPAPVTFREERSVGPSLGRDALEEAKVAFAVGAALVLVFMVVMYKVGGLIAMLCALLNIFFVLAVLSFANGTLSLPGIAGLLLTVGMAVDANVIINERMREEFQSGKTARAAIDSGYSSAFSAILDSNVSTALAGVVCLQFGSGPVQNFATTLLIGIASTMFTAVFVSRVLFDFYGRKDRESLAI